MSLRTNSLVSRVVLGCTFVAAAPWAVGLSARSPEGLAAILAERIGRGGAVALVLATLSDGRTGFAAAGGHSRRDPRPADEHTVFEIGSVSKVFTAALLAEMAERGEVALDTPIRSILPQHVRVPARNGREITLLDLATGTSGLPRLPSNLRPADLSNPYAEYSVEQLYAFLSGHVLEREPGAAYEYSNLGMGLLGHVLAVRAGRPYEALVVERILEPLGMHDTRITLTPAMCERLAPGHGPDLEPARGWDVDVLAGAAAWRSTAADLARFAAAAVSPPDTRLGRALTAAMAPRMPAGRPGLHVGLAWHVVDLNGRPVAWHNGQTGGYHAFLGIDRTRGAAVVLLGNAATDIDDIGLHVLDAAAPLRHPAAARPTISVGASELEEYVGRYELAPTFAIEVTREGDALFMQATGQQRFRAFAASPTRFFLRVVDAEIEFTRDPHGVVSGLVLHQGGRSTPGRKLPR